MRFGSALGYKKPNYNFVDMTGQRIGKLTVERRLRNAGGNARWLCRCDCGETIAMEGIYLREVKRKGLGATCRACRPRPRVRVRQPKLVRKPGKVCKLCWGLRHAVKGAVCAGCGLLADTA